MSVLIDIYWNYIITNMNEMIFIKNYNILILIIQSNNNLIKDFFYF